MKQNSLENSRNSATPDISRKTLLSSDKTKISPLCIRSCKTCLSPHVEEVHEMRLKGKMKLHDISFELERQFGEQISKASLCRHFQKYNIHIKNLANTQILKYTKTQVDFRSKHVSQLNDLINSMFEKLAVNWNTITPSINELSVLVKLRYQVMEGQIDLDDFNTQIVALIQNAEKIDNVANQVKMNFNQPKPAEVQGNDERSEEKASAQ